MKCKLDEIWGLTLDEVRPETPRKLANNIATSPAYHGDRS
jgi:hypothetical protein